MSVIPRRASASITRGSWRIATSHSCTSSTVMLGCPSGSWVQLSTASAVSETRAL